MSVDWSFAIDVGGTFTDCLAFHPDHPTRTVKVLSTGISKAQIDQLTEKTILDQ